MQIFFFFYFWNFFFIFEIFFLFFLFFKFFLFFIYFYFLKTILKFFKFLFYIIIFFFSNFIFLCKFSIDEVNLNGFCLSLSWIQGPCLKMWKSRSTFVSATFHYGNISSLWRTPALPDLSYKIRWSIYPFTCFLPTNIVICVIDVDRFN